MEGKGIDALAKFIFFLWLMRILKIVSLFAFISAAAYVVFRIFAN